MGGTSSGYLLGGFHEREPSEPGSLAAGVLAVRAERNFLPGPSEYRDRGEFAGRGIPPEPGAAGLGVHGVSAGLRIVSNARGMAGGPVRAAASAYGWRCVVGNLHGAYGFVADKSLGRRVFLYSGEISSGSGRSDYLSLFEPVRVAMDPFARTRQSEWIDLCGGWGGSGNGARFCELCDD